MDSEFAEGDEASLRKWLGWLEALIASLVDQDSNKPAFEVCENALEEWQKRITPENAPSPESPAALIIVETVLALSRTASAVAIDQTNTPDVRDRITPEAARETLNTELAKALNDGNSWLAGLVPSADEVKQRIEATKKEFQSIQETGQQQLDEQSQEDAEAAADPYGAVLGYVDPDVDAAIIFTKVCSFTQDEDRRYRAAHEELRHMIDSELLRHISDENKRFCDVLVETLADITNRRIALNDQDALDERRRRLRSALISFASAINSHKDQSIRAVREKFGRKTPQEQKVIELFDGLIDSSFDYRWLLKMRDALLHGDINAFKVHLNARLDGESEANVFMDRDYMLRFTKESREKWLKRSELEDMTTDPSVLDMIKAVQKPVAELQDKLDAVLYPNVAEDAGTVRELISRFEGRRGHYALQSGPGFTRRLRIPPHTFLAPRVLMFADTYEQETGA